MSVGTKVHPYKVGPRRPRSPAQRRTVSTWIRRCPWQYQQWLAAQPELPDGWSYKGGRLTPPKRLWTADGKLRQPNDPVLWDRPYGPFVFDELMIQGKKRRHQGSDATIKLEQRTWITGKLDEDDEDWIAIRSWLGDIRKMTGDSGRCSKFAFTKLPGRVVVHFTKPEVGFRFWATFA